MDDTKYTGQNIHGKILLYKWSYLVNSGVGVVHVPERKIDFAVAVLVHLHQPCDTYKEEEEEEENIHSQYGWRANAKQI